MNRKGLYTKLLICSVSLLLMATPLLSNQNIDRLLGRAEATADLDLYFKLIDEQHGNPYMYISRSAFISAFEKVKADLPQQIGYESFEYELTKLNTLLRCGHTVVNLDTKTFKALNNQQSFFPLPLAIIEEKAHIDFDHLAIPHGSELISINGQLLTNLLPQLKQLTVTDGFSETKPLRELETRFGYYYYLKVGPVNKFEIAFLTPDGELGKVTIDGVEGKQMIVNNYYRPLYQSHERYYHFTHLDAIDSLETLVLTLNTFRANPDWFYQRISSRYNDESKMFDFDYLVLDLRNNQGGDRRILNLLYEFFTGSQLVDPSNTFTRTLDISNQEYLQGINGSMPSTQRIEQAKNYLSKHFSTKDDGLFIGAEQNWHETFDPEISWDGVKFQGQLYVLTSGNTFSAAADFARILGQEPNVILIGEETGGGHVGRTANMLLTYGLPYSKSMVQIPVIYEEFINANMLENAGRGTFPDYFITQTYADLLGKKDTQFNFALELIQNQLRQGSN